MIPDELLLSHIEYVHPHQYILNSRGIKITQNPFNNYIRYQFSLSEELTADMIRSLLQIVRSV